VDPSGASSAPAPPQRRRELKTLAQGKRYEAYVEQQTAEMRLCVFCEKVYYRKKPMKQIGARWVCIDCLRALKETLDSLDRWEEMSILHETIERGVRGEVKR
jgi:hypothetical protein